MVDPTNYLTSKQQIFFYLFMIVGEQFNHSLVPSIEIFNVFLSNFPRYSYCQEVNFALLNETFFA